MSLLGLALLWACHSSELNNAFYPFPLPLLSPLLLSFLSVPLPWEALCCWFAGEMKDGFQGLIQKHSPSPKYLEVFVL